MVLRVVFFGTPAFAVPSLKALHAAGHQVLAAVCQPDAEKGRGQKVQAPPVKEAALALGIPVLQPARVKGDKGAEFRAQMKALAPDVAVVAAYGKILPQDLLDTPRAGCVNLHASILPRHRGASPIQHAILLGDPESGVCLMRMVLEMDAGGVFACARTPIEPADTSETLGARLSTLAATLCMTHLEDVVAGRVEAVPQDPALVTMAPMLTKEMGRLEWSRSAEEEDRRVRAMTPWPGAYVMRGADALKIHQVKALRDTPGKPPGTIVAMGGGAMDVACGTGVLRVLEVQPAGKRRMTAGEFANGARVKVGDVL